MSHSDSGAVRFYLSGRLAEWGTNVRQHLTQVAAQQHKDHLSLLLSRHWPGRWILRMLTWHERVHKRDGTPYP